MCRERGELQWTDYGISGVAVFQMSRFAILALEEGRTVQLSLDFMPEYSAGEVEELLRSCCDDCPYKSLQEMLSGILPAKLAPVILREAGLEADQMNIPLKQWRTEINDILRKISAIIGDFRCASPATNRYTYSPGYVGYEKAQVTRGGVTLSELSGNLESLCCPGLFFAGEVLDVDGPAAAIIFSGPFPAAASPDRQPGGEIKSKSRGAVLSNAGSAVKRKSGFRP